MKLLVLSASFFLLFCSCSDFELSQLSNAKVNIEKDSIVFAIIGDYGVNGEPAFKVAQMVKQWSPEFIITLGDNNYSNGNLSTIHNNIAQYYYDYIYNPDAPENFRCFGKAAVEKQNRFFPSLGNHDQHDRHSSEPYLSFFTLPGKETYYEFRWGPIHFFTINSGKHGEASCCNSEQALWLKQQLSASAFPFKVVFFHHPPYSTSHHGNTENMQWPFQEWGASVVISGHSHLYERINTIEAPDFYYLVNGLGGSPNRYPCHTKPLDENNFQHFCYDKNFGAMLAQANQNQLIFSFYNIDNPTEPIDHIQINF